MAAAVTVWTVRRIIDIFLCFRHFRGKKLMRLGYYTPIVVINFLVIFFPCLQCDCSIIKCLISIFGELNGRDGCEHVPAIREI